MPRLAYIIYRDEVGAQREPNLRSLHVRSASYLFMLANGTAKRNRKSKKKSAQSGWSQAGSEKSHF